MAATKTTTASTALPSSSTSSAIAHPGLHDLEPSSPNRRRRDSPPVDRPRRYPEAKEEEGGEEEVPESQRRRHLRPDSSSTSSTRHKPDSHQEVPSATSCANLPTTSRRDMLRDHQQRQLLQRSPAMASSLPTSSTSQQSQPLRTLRPTVQVHQLLCDVQGVSSRLRPFCLKGNEEDLPPDEALEAHNLLVGLHSSCVKLLEAIVNSAPPHHPTDVRPPPAASSSSSPSSPSISAPSTNPNNNFNNNLGSSSSSGQLASIRGDTAYPNLDRRPLHSSSPDTTPTHLSHLATSSSTFAPPSSSAAGSSMYPPTIYSPYVVTHRGDDQRGNSQFALAMSQPSPSMFLAPAMPSAAAYAAAAAAAAAGGAHQLPAFLYTHAVPVGGAHGQHGQHPGSGYASINNNNAQQHQQSQIQQSNHRGQDYSQLVDPRIPQPTHQDRLRLSASGANFFLPFAASGAGGPTGLGQQLPQLPTAMYPIEQMQHRGSSMSSRRSSSSFGGTIDELASSAAALLASSGSGSGSGSSIGKPRGSSDGRSPQRISSPSRRSDSVSDQIPSGGASEEAAGEPEAKKKRRRRTEGQRHCLQCGTENSRNWRKGPQGPASLCNSCGIKYYRLRKAKGKKKGKSGTTYEQCFSLQDLARSATEQNEEEEEEQSSSQDATLSTRSAPDLAATVSDNNNCHMTRKRTRASAPEISASTASSSPAKTAATSSSRSASSSDAEDAVPESTMKQTRQSDNEGEHNSERDHGRKRTKKVIGDIKSEDPDRPSSSTTDAQDRQSTSVSSSIYSLLN